jgi:hypothetical protein
MDLSKEIDRIEVVEQCIIQIRETTRVMDGDKEIAKTYHRYVLCPGDSLEGQPSKVQAVCQAVWTPDVIASYKEQLAANIKELA